MAKTIINADTEGVKITGGDTNELEIQTNGTAAITINATQQWVLANPLPIVSGGTGSSTGTFSGANITGLNATNITSGTLQIAQGGTGSATASFSGANITSLNASNITDGTIANARTTAASANGASTIVARDATGNFSANIITADGSALTSLNASSISSGTIANARTTAASANGASTIVARDATGNFSANTITATLSGNATNVSGTVAVGNGGTGATTLTAEAVIIGNTTSAVKFVSPGTAGNVLTSDGTVWASTAPAGGGGVTSLNGQTGAITNTGVGNIGSFMPLMRAATAVSSNYRSVIGTTYAGSGLRYNYTPMNAIYNEFQVNTAGGTGYALGGTAPSGTWRCIGRDVFYRNGCDGVWGVGLFVRIS